MIPSSFRILDWRLLKGETQPPENVKTVFGWPNKLVKNWNKNSDV